MPRHLELVRELDGGNKYREGRQDSNIRPYNAKERKGAYAARERGERAGDEEDWEEE
jgi:hypothetical protein